MLKGGVVERWWKGSSVGVSSRRTVVERRSDAVCDVKSTLFVTRNRRCW